MKRFLLIILLYVGCSAFAQNIYYENPDLPKPITVFSTKYSDSTPFWIRIGKTKYYLVKNRKDGKYTYRDIVGCDKPKKQLFNPFYEMNTDSDRTKLTSDELLEAGVRFVALKINGKLALEDKSKDFPVENVDYINMVTLSTYVGTYLRPYGKFTVYMKTDSGNRKKYIGHVEYQHPRYLEKLF